MVDTERRKKLAIHLRHLSVGLTTNDNFEESIMGDVTSSWLPEQYHRAKEANKHYHIWSFKSQAITEFGHSWEKRILKTNFQNNHF